MGSTRLCGLNKSYVIGISNTDIPIRSGCVWVGGWVVVVVCGEGFFRATTDGSHVFSQESKQALFV